MVTASVSKTSEIIARARAWKTRTHLKRTPEEIEAYLQALMDADVPQTTIDIVEEGLRPVI